MSGMRARLFSKTSRKYYASEILASLLALVLSAATAVLMDSMTDSDAAISVVSAVGGTLGFLCGTIGLYTLFHIRQYLSRQRRAAADIRSIFSANIRGIAAMYCFRIPCQYVLQKLGVAPPAAAVISQGLSGLIATAVRMHHNYRRKIFAGAEELAPGATPAKTAQLEQQ